MYIDDPKLLIDVSIWKSNTEIKKEKIDFIYQDDQIDVAIQKLLNYFNFTNIYVWISNESIEFNTSIALNNVNPFLFDKNQDIKQLKITEKKGIFNYQKINIVDQTIFKDDKKILKVFFNYYRTNTSINENKLNEIYNQSTQNEVLSAIITNYEVNTTVTLQHILKYYYRTVDNNFDIKGWIYDNYNKHFTVQNDKDYTSIIEHLNETQYDQETLIFLKYLIYLKSYYIIQITKNGEINVRFVLGYKIKYSIENVLKLKENVKDFITNLFHQEILLKDNVVKSQIDIKSPNFSINMFNKQSSLIYNFISKQDKIYIYNRTSSNTDSYDIETYIKELYKTSTTKNVNDILLHLSIHLTEKINTEELKELVENVINNESNLLTKIPKIYFTRKTFFTLRKSDNMHVSITINNIKSLLELNYFIFWISKVTYNSFKTEHQIVSDTIKSSSSSSEPIKSSSNKSSSSLGDLTSSDSSDSQSGGMPKKNVQLKQLNYLQVLDSQLFNKSDLYNNKTYAQICQSNRQPMALPTDTFKKYKDNVDNHLEINNNTYFCPRYWCLNSEQPILDKNKQKCEKDEEPIDLYSTKQGTFNKPDTPRYVNYYSKDYPKPCCYLKNKEVVLKTDVQPKNEDSQTAFSASNIHIFTIFNVVPENRYGILPKSILRLIDNKTPGLTCGQKLKSKKCAYRMGINKKKRDLMDILTKMLNYEKRIDLVKAIYNNLDLVKFVSLENGEIVREFMKKAFYKNYKKIDKAVLNRNYNINISADSRKPIDYAFNSYINYLRNDNVDNPHYLYSLIALLFKCNLYIWKFKKDTNFHLINPLYSSYDDNKLLSNSEKAINIFYYSDLDLFEPIVLKSTNALDYQFNFSSESYSELHKLYVPSNVNVDILQKISQYTTFCKKTNFKIKKILLNNNLTVNYFVLKNDNILKVDTIIEPILLNRLIDILLINDIDLYDNYYYNKHFNIDYVDSQEIKTKFNFDIIFSYLKPQRFDNSILPYNIIPLEKETKYDNQLIEIVDKTYETKNYDNEKFKQEMANHKDLEDWYNSYDFNNTFMTDKITYLKGKLVFSNKAINNYSNIFKQSHKIQIIKATNDKNDKVKQDIKLDSNFTKGELKALPSKFNSYKLHYVESLHYNNNSIYEFLSTILQQFNKKEVRELTINIIKKMFGSIESINILCYILDYKNIILTLLALPPDSKDKSTPINIIYEKYNKQSDIIKEQFINNIIKQFDTSEIDLYALSELFNISILVFHIRKYMLLNSEKEKIKRGSVEDISATCNLFINRNIRKDYEKHPFLMIYTDRNRLYFINNGYFIKGSDVTDNIKEIIKYKLKTYKDII